MNAMFDISYKWDLEYTVSRTSLIFIYNLTAIQMFDDGRQTSQ